MSRITHTQITITKSPMLKVPVEVPQWEAHVLLALWGDDAQITGTIVYDRELPETNDEFTRLANKYGPRDEDIPFVARVYGSFGPGLRGLENEFQASTAGSPVASVTEALPVVPEIDREKFDGAPQTLAGFDGSAAPTDVEAEELKLAETLKLEEDVDTFAGNTISGVSVESFLKSDVSDLTGDDSEAA